MVGSARAYGNPYENFSLRSIELLGVVEAEFGHGFGTIRFTSDSSWKQATKAKISFMEMEKHPVSMSGILRYRAQSRFNSTRQEIIT